MLVERLDDLSRIRSLCKCDAPRKCLSVSFITHDRYTHCAPLASPFTAPLASLGELMPLALAVLGAAGVSKAALRFDAPVEGR